MKNFNVGVIGCGFVGEGQAFSFSPISDVKVYDLDDKKSTASLEDTLKSDYIFVCVPTPMKKDGSQDFSFIENVFENAKRDQSILLNLQFFLVLLKNFKINLMN